MLSKTQCPNIKHVLPSSTGQHGMKEKEGIGSHSSPNVPLQLQFHRGSLLVKCPHVQVKLLFHVGCGVKIHGEGYKNCLLRLINLRFNFVNMHLPCKYTNKQHVTRKQGVYTFVNSG